VSAAVNVRRAGAGDRAVLAGLLSDMQAHYGSPDPHGGAYQWLLFLKDLYVTEQARGLGIGRALLTAMARIAIDQNYCRIDWTTDASNQGAQRLYDRLGVPRHDKPFYRLSGDDLRKFAAG